MAEATMDFTRARWITNGDFCDAPIRNVFHKQLEGSNKTPEDTIKDRHVLFRRKFTLDEKITEAKLAITADDYYRLYINGEFAGQGPAPGYPSSYRYNVIDVASFLREGENVIAVHTYYQGLVNRVWVSGDNRHGLLCELAVNGSTVLFSDDRWRTHLHTGFSPIGIAGYDTQFLVKYDSRAAEDRFFLPAFDDGAWERARYRKDPDYTLYRQETAMPVEEPIPPVTAVPVPGGTLYDFGSTYVGFLRVSAKGQNGETIVLRFGQELDDDGRVRFDMRCCCRYEEEWILSGGNDELRAIDYKSFRYAEILGASPNCAVTGVSLSARHYPFALRAGMDPAYREDEDLCRIWDLCVRTQKYGVQEVIQDCMDREKGFYLGDGCYSAITNYALTSDDSIVRKLIDDAFASSFITDGLVTCEDCSFMQEIAEYPLILIDLILWHYRLSGDAAYLRENYARACRLADGYRRDYERDLLLCDLDKWCVVEWPKNYQDGYDVDITEGKICHESHVSLGAYYIGAVRTLNKIASVLGEPPYRDEAPLVDRFVGTFYDKKTHLFRDGAQTKHQSYIGNLFPFAFGILPDDGFVSNMLAMIRERGIAGTSLFCTFLLLRGVIATGNGGMVGDLLKHPGAYLRMLREGATTTFEAWGKDEKWNTSLFHLTFSYAALFLSDTDLRALFA